MEALTKGHPEEFTTFFNYCRKLKFEEKPDYAYVRKLYKDLFFRMGYEYDYNYDWIIRKNEKLAL